MRERKNGSKDRAGKGRERKRKVERGGKGIK